MYQPFINREMATQLIPLQKDDEVQQLRGVFVGFFGWLFVCWVWLVGVWAQKKIKTSTDILMWVEKLNFKTYIKTKSTSQSFRGYFSDIGDIFQRPIVTFTIFRHNMVPVGPCVVALNQ